MDDSHFESITDSCSKRHDTIRGLERSETISRLFQIFWMCETIHIPDAKRSKLEDNSVSCVLFGVMCGTIHIPDAKRSKLEDNSVTCVLFGVNTESKGHRLSNPNKIIVSRNVAFEEDRE